jgi:hemerythrin-like domain-containing protein
MAVQIGAGPDCGFDDPIGMLKDCHRRIERFLNILWIVADRARGRALTGEEKSAVQAAMSYFQLGGKRHTADEEESLFPRLRAALASDGCEEVSGLEDDHRRANKLHLTVDSLYSAWIEAGRLSSENEERLQSATIELKKLYEAHIKIEEGTVFPRAAQMLDSQTIVAIGEELRARRMELPSTS